MPPVRRRSRDYVGAATGYFYAVVANRNRQFDRASGGIVQRTEDFGPSRRARLLWARRPIEQQPRGLLRPPVHRAQVRPGVATLPYPADRLTRRVLPVRSRRVPRRRQPHLRISRGRFRLYVFVVPHPLDSASTSTAAGSVAQQTQLETLNNALAALGLSAADIQQIDQVASLTNDFSPTAFTSLAYQLEAQAQNSAAPTSSAQSTQAAVAGSTATGVSATSTAATPATAQSSSSSHSGSNGQNFEIASTRSVKLQRLRPRPLTPHRRPRPRRPPHPLKPLFLPAGRASDDVRAAS